MRVLERVALVGADKKPDGRTFFLPAIALVEQGKPAAEIAHGCRQAIRLVGRSANQPVRDPARGQHVGLAGHRGRVHLALKGQP